MSARRIVASSHRRIVLALLAALTPSRAQDLNHRQPLLCDKINPRQRPAPLELTIKQIQSTVQGDPVPALARESCLHTETTASSAGHTFPSVRSTAVGARGPLTRLTLHPATVADPTPLPFL